ncbi:MAG: LptF/LptG family permease [Terrimicrobiaceae bacterium]|jgi:LPS export ABC transporter permease LptG
MTILDRYVLQKFLVPFLYCFLGFIGIWFIFDLSDNLPDFIQGKASFPDLLAYYASQIPEIFVICLPIALLLALLYSLTAMSRSNEIISMLGAGLSVTRILVPLMVIGLLLTGATAMFNFEGAPHAAAAKKQMIRDIKRGKKSEAVIRGHLFRNRIDRRTWFSRDVNLGRNRLQDVQIIQQNEAGEILHQWYAREAYFDPNMSDWKLLDARYVEMNPGGDITKSESAQELHLTGWSETPWRIASSRMNPDYLSVPELRDYLNFNSDFPEVRLAPFRTHLDYRFALPWVCFVAVFLAAPMGIVYSRRGILGGVAVAIGLFFSLVFLSSLFIALGKGGRLSPFVAAWVPMIVFFVVGLFLLWLRSTNRELNKIKIPGF